jgi:hypothetical protein
MPDSSAALPTTELAEAFLRVVDVEGKLIAALEDLGPVSGRDVVVLDAGEGHLERQLAAIGARVTAVAFPRGADGTDSPDPGAAAALVAALPAAEADAVVVPWSELAVPDSSFIEAAERLLRPGGRLMLVHDYGRDDVWSLWPGRRDRLVLWSQRRGPFLGSGFRVRVIHCWWTFESAEQARDLLVAGFGEPGAELAGQMKRPRLEYQVAIYHRSCPVQTDSAGTQREAAAVG